MRKVIIFILIGIVGAIILGIKERISPSCSAQISQCKDNADVVNNYVGMSEAKARCVSMANDMAKFGRPEWPWLPFSAFAKGDDFPSRNAVVLFDDDVMFSNGFGATQRTPLRCDYDFASGTAIVVLQ